MENRKSVCYTIFMADEKFETFDNTDLLEPIDFYTKKLKEAFHNNAIKLYEEMTDKAQTNVDENQKQCKIYYDESKIANELTKKNNGKKALKVLTIIAVVLLFLTAAAGVGSFFLEDNNWPIYVKIIMIVLGIGGGVGLILLAIKISRQIKDLQKIIDEHNVKAQNAKEEANNLMASLFNLYEWNMAASLMSKTTPLIQLDPVFDGEKFQYLNEKYGFEEYNGTDSSVLYVQSGSILGNPFVFQKCRVQDWVNHTYEGTLVITWTETTTDSEGHVHTTRRTQTLRAYVTKPVPNYFLDTILIYGNQAAPNLSFTRQPTDINKMNDKQISNYVKSFDKKLDKMVAESIKKGGNFTRLHNEEFEALFNALDRDNEMEFRLLFTPLGQKNMIALLKSKNVAFGDDFQFAKRKKLNYVRAAHMQGSDSLDRNPYTLMNFDYKVAKDAFVNYCDKYLRDVYFNLAPVISIPVYQQHKTIEYIYENKFAHNVTQSEVESAANVFDINLFKHPATRSAGVILKSHFDSKYKEADHCVISAHSFEGIDRIEYVSVYGGDGRYHQVPVHWIEYLPIVKNTPFVVADTNADKTGFQELYKSGKFNDVMDRFGVSSSGTVYRKRLFSFLPKE